MSLYEKIYFLVYPLFLQKRIICIHVVSNEFMKTDTTRLRIYNISNRSRDQISLHQSVSGFRTPKLYFCSAVYKLIIKNAFIIQFERLYFEDNLSFSMATAVNLFCLLCLALNIALSMLLELVTNLRPVNDDTTRNIKLDNKTICKLKN